MGTRDRPRWRCCKRRGFIYGAFEIYGGITGFWDYGPLGTQPKRNLRRIIEALRS